MICLHPTKACDGDRVTSVQVSAGDDAIMTLFIDVIIQTGPWQSYAGRSVALRFFFIVGQLQVYFLTQAYRQKRGYAFLNLYVNRFVGGGLVVNQFWANYACPGITSNTSVCCVGKC